MTSKAPALFVESVSAKRSVTGHDELYLVMDGKRIAYRGHPRTPDAGKWVPLIPGLSFDGPDDDDAPVIDAGFVALVEEPTARCIRRAS
jgi:hypothetical protein